MTKPYKMAARDLLHRASIHSSSRVTTIHGHYSGARIGTFGSREIDAANELVMMGLLKHVGSHNSRVHINQGRTTCHTWENVYEITEEGRKIAKNC